MRADREREKGPIYATMFSGEMGKTFRFQVLTANNENGTKNGRNATVRCLSEAKSVSASRGPYVGIAEDDSVGGDAMSVRG